MNGRFVFNLHAHTHTYVYIYIYHHPFSENDRYTWTRVNNVFETQDKVLVTTYIYNIHYNIYIYII